MGGDARRCCCGGLICYECGNCCYSTTSKVKITYDITALLAAYIAEWGEDAATEFWSSRQTGTFEGIYYYELGASFVWSRSFPAPDNGGIGVTAYKYCTPGEWRFYINANAGSSGGWDNLGFVDGVDGECCGVGPLEVAGRFNGIGHETTGTMTIAIEVSNNRCEHVEHGDLTVTGTLTPDATGEYDLDPVNTPHNGENVYKRQDGAYYIYAVPFMGTIWAIGTAVDDTFGSWLWDKGVPGGTVTGSYPNNGGGSTGTAVVSALTDCTATTEDQCP